MMCATSVFFIAISLRDFIRATAKEFQVANNAKAAKATWPAVAEQEIRGAEGAMPVCNRAASVRDEEEVPV